MMIQSMGKLKNKSVSVKTNTHLFFSDHWIEEGGELMKSNVTLSKYEGNTRFVVVELLSFHERLDCPYGKLTMTGLFRRYSLLWVLYRPFGKSLFRFIVVEILSSPAATGRGDRCKSKQGAPFNGNNRLEFVYSFSSFPCLLLAHFRYSPYTVLMIFANITREIPFL